MASVDYRKINLLATGVLLLPTHNRHRQSPGRLRMIRRAKKWERVRVDEEIRGAINERVEPALLDD